MSLFVAGVSAFSWTVPWLSWLMVIVLVLVTLVLYLVPLRWLVLAWGVNKFTKKLRAPDSIANNELLDYLSRVPSDRELVCTSLPGVALTFLRWAVSPTKKF